MKIEKKFLLNVLAAMSILGLLLFCEKADDSIVLLPVDESATEPHFIKFRNDLLNALSNKDTGFIVNILADDVQIGFGPEDAGKQAFEEKWFAPQSDSSFWSTAIAIIQMGCVKELEDAVFYFACSYVYSRFPADKDPYSWVAVVAKDIAIYADSSTTSRVVGKISYEVLPFDGGGSTAWFKAPSQGKRPAGFIERKFVRSPNDYRIQFREYDGHWLISAFVAGD